MIAQPQTRDVVDLPIEQGIAGLKEMILARFPGTVFQAFPNTDPPGIYLRVTVDIDDPDEVIDLILPRLVEMQLEEGLPIYPVAVRPIERIMSAVNEPGRR
jgi:hypothetical protein